MLTASPSQRVCRAVMDSPLPGGLRVSLGFVGEQLAELDFVAATTPLFAERRPEVEQAIRVLRGYFTQPGNMTSLLPALHVSGTAFQQRVWQALCEIPTGRTCRYGELARSLGSSARAVAGACRANPLPILIPCHRVVAADGPGGYMGQTAGQALAIKRWLLHHEHHAG